MHDFEHRPTAPRLTRRHLLHHPISVLAVRALANLLTLLEYLLADSLLDHVAQIGVDQASSEADLVLFIQQHVGAPLADRLQDADDAAEVADVEDGQLQIHVAEVAHAVVQPLPTGLARRFLLIRTL